MAYDPNRLKTEPIPKAPIVVIYAKSGIGKSTFLKSVPQIMVADIEDKLNNTKIMRDTFKTYEDFNDWMEWVLSLDKPDFKAIGIDSIDWLEMLVHKKICKDKQATSISDPYIKATAFGNGYILAANVFKNEVIPKLEQIRDKFNMPILLVCHSTVVASKSPDSDPYDVYELKLHEKTQTVLTERVEAKVFLKCKDDVDQEGRRMPTNKRILITTPQKGIEAKNNLQLPDIIEISESNGWQDFINVLYTKQPIN